MDILRKNTTPQFEIVARYELDAELSYTIKLSDTQNITCSISELPNENYNLLLATFPNGKIGTKLSYVVVETISNKVVCLGKILIVSETQDIQNYSKKSNTKFYV